MRLLKNISDARYAVYAAATVFTFAMQSPAEAGPGTVGDIADNLKGQVGQLGTFLVAAAVLIGVGFVIAGLMKLKQAADTQGQQVKYGDGLWRLAVGTGLVAVPAFTGTLASTFGFDNPSINTADGF